MKYAVEASKVCFSYGPLLVLKDVSFRLKAGEFLAIIGPNGGGKSTLVKLILGLVKPLSGSMKVYGEDAGRSLLGYVPQNVNVRRDFPATALDVVMMGAIVVSKNKKEALCKSRDALNMVGAEKFTNVRINELSGGVLQKAMIARALVLDSKMILMDEPLANIDEQSQRSIYDRLASLKGDKTVVIVSHDTGAVTKHATSIACVNNIMHYHDVADSLSPEDLQAVYGDDRVLSHIHLKQHSNCSFEDGHGDDCDG